MIAPMEIRFTQHAEEKFDTLKRHGVAVSRSRVIVTLEHPDVLDRSRYPLLIAQGNLDQQHVLRVVYRREAGVLVIITFYPGRKSQYEKTQ